MGLSLTAVGVALAVASPGRYADTVARYVYVGGVGALVTLAAASLVGRAEMWLLGDAGLASAMSPVGGLGGAVLKNRVAVGDRRSRPLGIRARFDEPANERLRHEVFDAATVIDGITETATTGPSTVSDAVGRPETTVDAVAGHCGDDERSRLAPPRYVGVRSRDGPLPAGLPYHLLQY